LLLSTHVCFIAMQYVCMHWCCFLEFFFREGATRSGLVLRGPGLETLWSLTTLTSSESTACLEKQLYLKKRCL
jgi:hypothetical protein